MGGSQSNEASEHSTKGYHVIRVLPHSPGQVAQLQSYFDFIVSAAGKRLHTEDDTLKNLLSAHINKSLSLTVYDLRTGGERGVTLTPSDSWGGRGLLGASIRFCSLDKILEMVWHVLEVHPNSPASAAGLISNSDYIVGADTLLEQADDLYELISSHEGRALRLYVYNTLTEDCREISITPNRAWGGDGRDTKAAHCETSAQFIKKVHKGLYGSKILGCGIGFGYLHRIPVQNSESHLTPSSAQIQLEEESRNVASSPQNSNTSEVVNSSLHPSQLLEPSRVVELSQGLEPCQEIKPQQGFEPQQGFTVPQGFESQQGFQLPQTFESQQGFQLPQTFESQQGFQLPQTFESQQGFQLPQTFESQQGFQLPQTFESQQGFQLPQTFESQQGFQLPQTFESQQGFQLPQTFESQQGFQLPQTFESQQGFQLPQTFESQQGFQLPQTFESQQGFQLPQTFESQQGFQLPQGFESPQGLQLHGFEPLHGLPQGSVELRHDFEPSLSVQQGLALKPPGVENQVELNSTIMCGESANLKVAQRQIQGNVASVQDVTLELNRERLTGLERENNRVSQLSAEQSSEQSDIISIMSQTRVDDSVTGQQQHETVPGMVESGLHSTENIGQMNENVGQVRENIGKYSEIVENISQESVDIGQSSENMSQSSENIGQVSDFNTDEVNDDTSGAFEEISRTVDTRDQTDNRKTVSDNELRDESCRIEGLRVSGDIMTDIPESSDCLSSAHDNISSFSGSQAHEDLVNILNTEFSNNVMTQSCERSACNSNDVNSDAKKLNTCPNVVHSSCDKTEDLMNTDEVESREKSLLNAEDLSTVNVVPELYKSDVKLRADDDTTSDGMISNDTINSDVIAQPHSSESVSSHRETETGGTGEGLLSGVKENKEENLNDLNFSILSDVNDPMLDDDDDDDDIMNEIERDLAAAATVSTTSTTATHATANATSHANTTLNAINNSTLNATNTATSNSVTTVACSDLTNDESSDEFNKTNNNSKTSAVDTAESASCDTVTSADLISDEMSTVVSHDAELSHAERSQVTGDTVTDAIDENSLNQMSVENIKQEQLSDKVKEIKELVHSNLSEPWADNNVLIEDRITSENSHAENIDTTIKDRDGNIITPDPSNDRLNEVNDNAAQSDKEMLKEFDSAENSLISESIADSEISTTVRDSVDSVDMKSSLDLIESSEVCQQEGLSEAGDVGEAESLGEAGGVGEAESLGEAGGLGEDESLGEAGGVGEAGDEVGADLSSKGEINQKTGESSKVVKESKTKTEATTKSKENKRRKKKKS